MTKPDGGDPKKMEKKAALPRFLSNADRCWWVDRCLFPFIEQELEPKSEAVTGLYEHDTWGHHGCETLQKRRWDVGFQLSVFQAKSSPKFFENPGSMFSGYHYYGPLQTGSATLCVFMTARWLWTSDSFVLWECSWHCNMSKLHTSHRFITANKTNKNWAGNACNGYFNSDASKR